MPIMASKRIVRIQFSPLTNEGIAALRRLHYDKDGEPKSSLASEKFRLSVFMERGYLIFTEINYERKTEICQVNNNQI